MRVLWDAEDDCEAINYDGTKPEIIDDRTVIIKELGCNCDPSSGSMCGGCIDIFEEFPIGNCEQYFWKEVVNDTSCERT